MLYIACTIGPSKIHGTGLFAATNILKNQVLYSWHPSIDSRKPLDMASDDDRNYGYVNPLLPNKLSICGDHAKWWNFPLVGEASNSIEGDISEFNERMVIAANDILCGTELTIDPSTDLDYSRKLGI
jgi:hypothetical protein